MSLPEFNEKGDLPPGVYRVSMEDVLARFGTGSRARQQAASTLTRILRLSESTNQLDRLILFGSFVTAKADPNDVDVILVMDDNFQLEKCPSQAAVLFDHARAQDELGASVFWIRPSLLILDSMEQFIDRWQVTREGSLRGIVEVFR